jgi:hypothetical protein
MKDTRNGHGAYVRKVQEGTQSFTHDLLGEIERLHVLVASLQVEKETLDERTGEIQQVLSANECQGRRVTEAETTACTSRSLAANERFESEHARLSAQPDRTRRARATALRRDRDAELEPGEPLRRRLSAARYADRSKVIDTLQEIIANLIVGGGGLYELHEASRRWLVASSAAPTRTARFRSAAPRRPGREERDIFAASRGVSEPTAA